MLPNPASASVAGRFRVAIGNNALFPNPTQTAQRNSYIVLQAWESARAAQLKAANPNLLVLVYQNLSAMAQGIGPGGLSSSGVNYAEATTAHPEWFLTEASGIRIAEEGYAWLWMADIGNPGYQQLWTANVIRLLQSGPWDGVMMDDTNTTPRYHVHPQSRIAKYPNDTTYQAAVHSMLAYAGPAIQAAGKLAIPNIGSWSEYPQVAQEWLQFVSGGVDEMFVKWSSTPGQGYRDPSGWQSQVEEIQTAERTGKRFLAITQSAATDTQAIRYGWASVLLAAGGHAAFTAATNYSEEIWTSEYEVPLGEPTSSATKIAGGGWKRTFTEGLVVVNPTTTNVSVSFGGSYSGSGLTNATGATLVPNSAVILTGRATKSERQGGEGSSGTAKSETGAGGTGLSEAGTSGTGSSGTGTSGTGTPTGGTGATGVTTGGTTTSTPVTPVTPPTLAKPGRHRHLSVRSKAKATIASIHAAPAQCRPGAAAARRRGRSAVRRRTSCAPASTPAARPRVKRGAPLTVVAGSRHSSAARHGSPAARGHAQLPSSPQLPISRSYRRS
jgi:hypothetical protein